MLVQMAAPVQYAAQWHHATAILLQAPVTLMPQVSQGRFPIFYPPLCVASKRFV